MDKLTVFIALTAIAVLLQAGVLLAIYLAVRKGGERMEALATEVRTKVLPSLDQAQAILSDARPKLHTIADHLQQTSTTVLNQVERIDATVSDVVDRARLQVIRADELLSRTMDRVEQTSEMVHKTVVSPVRYLSGIMKGITVGLEFLFSGRGRRNGGGREERRPVPQDEMFI
jgi:methyl-accepting chemotaxis protein